MAGAGYGSFRCKLPLKSADGSALFAPPRPILADRRVRHAGEIVAVVKVEVVPVDAEGNKINVVAAEPREETPEEEAAGEPEVPAEASNV